MVFSPFNVYWIQFANILNIFVSIFIKDIGLLLFIFFFCSVFVWLWYQGDSGVME